MQTKENSYAAKQEKINQRVKVHIESKTNNPPKQNHKFPLAKYFYCLTCLKLVYN